MRNDKGRRERVWTRLTDSYGAKFVEAYGENPNDTWCQVIDDMSDDQIRYALRQVMRESPAFPPTLGQFEQAGRSLPKPVDPGQKYSIQEQLCAYVVLTRLPSHGGPQCGTVWTYLYREWVDETLPKWRQKCAECTGVVVPPVGDLPAFRVDVAEMRADTVGGHARAIASFRPGPQPRKVAVPDLRA